jgi:hypothetical protein
MAKRDLLKLPDDLEGNLRALLHTPPPPAGIPGSRKSGKPPKRHRGKPDVGPKARKRSKPKPPKVAGRYAYEAAPVVTRKRKAAKKR